MAEATATAPRWGLGDVAVGLTPVYLNALALLVASGSDSGDSTTVTISAIVVSSLFTWTFFLGVPAYATARKGNGLVVDLGLTVRAWDIPTGFALGVVLQAIVVPLLYVPVFWLWKSLDNKDVSHNAKQLTDAAHGAGLVVLVLVLVVAAPIIEEIFFRGLLMRSLARRIGPAWAVPVQALVFAGAHLEGIEFPALLLFGLVAGMLARRTGRLGPGIAAHMGFNAFTVFALSVLHWA